MNISTKNKYLIFLGGVTFLLLYIFIYTEQPALKDVSSTPETKDEAIGFEVTSPVQALSNTEWVWQYTSIQDGTKVTAPEGKFVLTFGNNSTVTSTTDCNTLSSSYMQTTNEIKFSPFASTRMFCKQSLESTYSEQLLLATSYYITDNEMRFNLNKDEGVMIFKRK
jgi:heat shock protein HslJ